MLQQHKCVSVKFPPTCQGGESGFMKYHIDKSGNIRELYDYNKTVYFVCNINDKKVFNKNFCHMKDAVAITPSTANWYRN